MAKEYRLEVGEIPSKHRVGFYDQIVADFIKGVLDNPDAKSKSARVVAAGKAPKTLQIGLAKAVGLSERKDIMVTMRGADVWLVAK
jgi:hypothetical protein